MAQAASKTCEICVSATGSWYCLDCEQHYCENCKMLHSRQKLSTNHEFQIASDFIPEVKLKCNDHNEAFSFVCVPCDVPVCVCCVTEKHDGHKLSQLKNIIVQLKTKIEHEILTKINKANGNVSSLEQNLSTFNDQVESVIKAITEEGNKIKSMVDQYTAKKIASLEEQSRKESKRLSAILSDQKTAFENANALKNRKKSIEEQSRHDGRLIQILKTLNEDIDKVEICSLPVFPSATYTQKIINENDISQLLGTLKLCKTETETYIKMESRPQERKQRKRELPEKTQKECIHQERKQSDILHICSICGKQEIQTAYLRRNFICCQMPMEKYMI